MQYDFINSWYYKHFLNKDNSLVQSIQQQKWLESVYFRRNKYHNFVRSTALLVTFFSLYIFHTYIHNINFKMKVYQNNLVVSLAQFYLWTIYLSLFPSTLSPFSNDIILYSSLSISVQASHINLDTSCQVCTNTMNRDLVNLHVTWCGAY